MSERQSRKHKRSGEGSLPPAKRENRTAAKRPFPADDPQNSDVDDGEGSFSEADLSRVTSQDIEEGHLLKEADAGVMEKVELYDFMCHEHLELNLSPNVNFILGRNGSGKSAIMTGIVVALGGKAKSTERGSSLKQFIRTGATGSKVVVHLRNRGQEAYKPEEYGETIICERAIKDDGTTQYKIKSKRGRVVSTKREELVAITDHCNIQIDNPVSLLNQDTSRNFLHNSKPTAKYKLFMKATHLEQIAIDYQRSREEIRLMEERIEAVWMSIPALRDETKRLEERVESFKRFTEMEDRIAQLENELKWAIVMEMEATIAPIEDSIKKERARIPRNQDRAKTAQNAVDAAKQEIKEAQNSFTQVTKEIKEVTAERAIVGTEKREKTSNVRQQQSKLNQITKQIGELKKEKDALERAKQESIKASQRDVKGERELRLREVQKMEEQLRLIEGEITTAENERRQFHGALKRNEDMISAHNARKEALQARISECQDQLGRLQSSRSDKLAAYGRNMTALVNALNRNRNKFRHVPKGPIGSMISLRDYKWSTAVEQALKYSILKGFAVDNQEDAAEFKKIAKQVMRGEQIPEAIVSSFQGTMYDVSYNRAQSSYPTVYDMLEVTDPDVMNVLIDQAHIENILLIEDRETANRVITHERPRGAAGVYTLSGDQVLAGRHYSNKSTAYGFIKESVDTVIREEQMRLDSLQGELQHLRQEGHSLDTEYNTNKSMGNSLGLKIRHKCEEKKKLSMKLMELKNAREEEEEPEDDIATYESEIAEQDEQISGKEKEATDQQQVLCAAKAEVDEVNRRYQETESKKDRVQARHEELTARLHEGENKRKRAEKRLKVCQEKISEITGNIAELEDKLRDQQEAVRVAVETAEEGCERVETEKTRQDISSEIRSLKRHISEDQPSLEEQERVTKEYTESMEKFQKRMTNYKTMKNTSRELKKSIVDRMTGYQKLQERVAMRTCYYFAFFLRQRDYDGKLKFDHEKEQLIIQVQVDSHTQKSQATSNAKALSGGERSFTTVCFIMALWDAIEAPFRCLDEFDVFMDMVNRRISMRMMMEIAEDAPSKQFIFFTPQDMSSMGVSGGKMVKVQRLPEPVRGGQTTLRDYQS